MAPSVNLADEIAATQLLVAQMARKLMGQTSPAQLAQAAAAAGLSVAQARQFLAGLVVLPPHQGVTFVSALLEQQRVREASYTMQIRQPHAGADLMGDGQPLTPEAVEAATARLKADFPGWVVRVDGLKALGTGKPVKLVWLGERDGVTCAGVDAGELRGKLELAVAAAAAEADEQERYRDGRGVTRRMGRTA